MRRTFCLCLGWVMLAMSGLLVSCSGETQVVKGVSLEEAGYTIAFPDQLTVDLFGNEMSYQAMTYLQTFAMEDSSYRPFYLEDGYTQLALYFFTPYSLGSLAGPTVMWLQAFPKSQINRHTEVRIGSEDYLFSALKEYAVYEDKETIIINLYDFVEDKDFSAAVQEMIEAENEGISKAVESGLTRHPEPELLQMEQFQFLLDLNRYYQDEIGSLIKKKS